jgi:hypothetical protein
VIVLFAFILFSDFTVLPEDGHWIDYARTGYLSENRYVVFQHQGTKGQYDLGPSRVQILSRAGQLLYEIPTAADAWFVKNGVLGDEDVFVYQIRSESTFYLWHPDFGPRSMDQPGLNLGRKGPIGMILSADGKRLNFVSEYRDMVSTAEAEGRLVVEIEEVRFDYSHPQDLFIADNLAFHYRNFVIPSRFQVKISSESILLISLLKEKVYLEYKFQIGDAEAALVRKELPFQIGDMFQVGPYISLSSPINGVDHMMFLHEDGTIYFQVARPQFYTTTGQELRNFLAAFEKGYTKFEQNTFSYLDQQFQIEVDVANKVIRKYAHGYSTTDLTSPDARELMEVTADRFEIKTIDAVSRNQNFGSPQVELPITAEFLWSE